VIVLLDAGPMGRVTNPRATPENLQYTRWMNALLTGGVRVMVPEIADYEVRRELLRANRLRGIAHLDRAKRTLGYVPITTAAMLQAAEFWAHARKQGQPTTVDEALDADVILAAQAVLLAAEEGDRVVIATTNVRHRARFADADLWQNIAAPAPSPSPPSP
jgi:predicted nucleic acid-binding protein